MTPKGCCDCPARAPLCHTGHGATILRHGKPISGEGQHGRGGKHHRLKAGDWTDLQIILIKCRKSGRKEFIATAVTRSHFQINLQVAACYVFYSGLNWISNGKNTWMKTAREVHFPWLYQKESFHNKMATLSHGLHRLPTFWTRP